MRITDIVNKEVANITTCESEPIHIPGSIQPHGLLLAVDSATGIIRYCSANTERFTGRVPAQLLDQLLSTLSEPLWTAIQPVISKGQALSHPVHFQYNNQSFDVLVHPGEAITILEFEQHVGPADNPYHLFDQTKQFVSIIERSKSLRELCQHIAHETRKQTGYDRVMIYRFDKEYNGEVFAESKRDDMPPFLGLHYPHTDIPQQARDLFLRNMVRMIVDVAYEPVPLLTTDNGAVQPLDLSDAGLRSVSPIHIQYLKNMGVGASLTISLLLDGKLWGLITCHHKQPLQLSYAQRAQALLQGHFLTSQIRVRQVAEEHEVNITVEAHLQQLLNKIEAEEDFDQKFEQFTSLLAVTNATGVAILHKGQLYEKGRVPPRDKILALIKWIGQNIKPMLFSTHCLHKRYPEAKAFSKLASGIVFHALGKTTENCIIWFREELEQTVNWAGKPDTAVQNDPVTKSLTPRKSFEIWKEVVQYQSQEWRVSEINAAIRFATTLSNHFHLTYLQQEEYNLRVLNEKLQNANQELANVNWITSHDLKEPLRKIQVFASRIADQEGQQLSDVIRDHTVRIQNAAQRMQHLVDDILSYTVTNNGQSLFGIADLDAILRTTKEELKDELEETGGVIHNGPMPQHIRAIPYQMQQLLNNLLSNAIKFARKDTPPIIYVNCHTTQGREVTEVTLPRDQAFYCITIKDNGIGFDSAHAQRIFDIFYRLHNASEYKGTGVGLAICKKIAENHGGAITGAGEKEKGAQFNIYLPV